MEQLEMPCYRGHQGNYQKKGEASPSKIETDTIERYF